MTHTDLVRDRTRTAAGPAAGEVLDPAVDFAAVYEAHYEAVYRAARGIVLDPDLAEDVTQDAFLKAYRARERYRPTGTIEGWLCTIAVREGISRLRWSALQRRLLSTVGRAQAMVPEPAGHGASALEELLAALTPKTRAVVVLHFLHGYRYREIAEMLHIPAGTVGSRLSQAMAVLRRQAGREP